LQVFTEWFAHLDDDERRKLKKSNIDETTGGALAFMEVKS
jgi:hypothetical protein